MGCVALLEKEALLRSMDGAWHGMACLKEHSNAHKDAIGAMVLIQNTTGIISFNSTNKY